MSGYIDSNSEINEKEILDKINQNTKQLFFIKKEVLNITKKLNTKIAWLIDLLPDGSQTYELDITEQGWKSFEFVKEFNNIPNINAILQGDSVEIPILKNITTKGFLYKNNILGKLKIIAREE